MLKSDVVSRRRFHAGELREVNVSTTAESLLALWFFVARHGASCTQVVVLHPEPSR